jgi:hypothetical protein
VNSTPCLNGTLTNGASQITSFVVSLGRAMLADKCRDWIDMDFAAKCCREHGLQLHGRYLGTNELETVLRRCFHDQHEFYAPGVNVDGYERRVGWDTVFCIRAYPNGPVQPLAPGNDHGPEATGANASVEGSTPIISG